LFKISLLAITLYHKLSFEIEGVLKKDRRHADGKYYNTILMGRWKKEGAAYWAVLYFFTGNGHISIVADVFQGEAE
jgi:hypothetical protein